MSLTRLLAAALIVGPLAGLGILTVAQPADAACRPRPANLQSHLMDASDVFSGTVTDRQRSGDRLVYTVEVDRVYKGTVDSSEVPVATDRRRGGCGLTDLQTGADYVVMAHSDGSELTTDQRSGTARATDSYVARVERILGNGHSPTPPPEIEATFTTVAGEPTGFARLAAPGIALVIVGVLGLGLVIGLSRRT